MKRNNNLTCERIPQGCFRGGVEMIPPGGWRGGAEMIPAGGWRIEDEKKHTDDTKNEENTKVEQPEIPLTGWKGYRGH